VKLQALGVDSMGFVWLGWIGTAGGDPQALLPQAGFGFHREFAGRSRQHGSVQWSTLFR